MVSKKERNQALLLVHETGPGYTFEKLGQAFGISKQAAYQIVARSKKCDIIRNMESKIKIDKPISATEASKLTGIPTSSIFDWVSRGLVKIVQRPDRRACTGQPVLLDPVSLQERIDRYRPRKNHQETATA